MKITGMKMGSCRSKNSAATAADGSGERVKNEESSRDSQDTSFSKSQSDGLTGKKVEQEDTDTTAALVHALIPIVLPIVRRALCKQLIDGGFILRDEEPVISYDNKSSDNDLPLSPIKVLMEGLRVVDAKSVQQDMDLDQDFKWPERERVEKLMKMIPGVGIGMVVLDLIGFEAEIHLGKGIELALPVDGPMGSKATIEVGSGGKIVDPSLKIRFPKLRVWFVNETSKLYAAFMERPNIVPYLHANVDRGNGDFLDMTITEDGTLDDIVETALSGFGPNRCDAQQREKRSGNFSSFFSKGWVANAIGHKISEEINKVAGMGNGNPIEVDLKEQIDNAKSVALGEPRPVEEIREEIKLLEAELERSLAQESEGERQDKKHSKGTTNHTGAVTEESKEVPNENESEFASCSAFEPFQRCLQCE